MQKYAEAIRTAVQALKIVPGFAQAWQVLCMPIPPHASAYAPFFLLESLAVSWLSSAP